MRCNRRGKFPYPYTVRGAEEKQEANRHSCVDPPGSVGIVALAALSTTSVWAQ